MSDDQLQNESEARAYDVTVDDQGTICLLQAQTDAGGTWLREHIDHATRWGGAYVVETHFVNEILSGISGDGLTIAPFN